MSGLVYGYLYYPVFRLLVIYRIFYTDVGLGFEDLELLVGGEACTVHYSEIGRPSLSTTVLSELNNWRIEFANIGGRVLELGVELGWRIFGINPPSFDSLHSVCVTSRVSTKRLLIHTEPSKRIKARLKECE